MSGATQLWATIPILLLVLSEVNIAKTTMSKFKVWLCGIFAWINFFTLLSRSSDHSDSSGICHVWTRCHQTLNPVTVFTVTATIMLFKQSCVTILSCEMMCDYIILCNMTSTKLKMWHEGFSCSVCKCCRYDRQNIGPDHRQNAIRLHDFTSHKKKNRCDKTICFQAVFLAKNSISIWCIMWLTCRE